MDKSAGYVICLLGGIVLLMNMWMPRVLAEEEEAEASLPPPSALAQQLAAYIRTVQHPSTGLPSSFANSVDHELDGVAFTYDVAVSALALTHAGALDAAQRALNLYLRMPLPSGRTFDFNTAYHVASGKPTLEFRVHGGPLFWMAIALMRYAQARGDARAFEKACELLEWARTHLPHREGGVAMSHRDSWSAVTSVENNWVYYAALRLAISFLPDGKQREAFLKEKARLRQWLAKHQGKRGADDAVKALDVYTHALLVGPEAHLEDGAVSGPQALAQWAKAQIAELTLLFQIPDSALYDYTDGQECQAIGRGRAAWLEGTEQVSVAYQTWAPWFEQRGDEAFAKELRMNAALSHAQVVRHALASPPQGVAVPNTDAVLAFLTFRDGWYARPRSEPALNGTNWAYLAEVGYNPFVMKAPRREAAR